MFHIKICYILFVLFSGKSILFITLILNGLLNFVFFFLTNDRQRVIGNSSPVPKKKNENLPNF